MKSIRIISVALALFAVSAQSAKIEQNILLTGGTNGLGVKYSIAYTAISLDCGLPLMFNYKQLTTNEGHPSFLIVFDQYFSFEYAFINKPKAVCKIGVSEFNRLTFKHVEYKDSSLVSQNFNDVDCRVGFTLEYINRTKLVKRFGFQVTPISFTITPGERMLVSVIQLNYYLHRRGENKTTSKGE